MEGVGDGDAMNGPGSKLIP
ncbi:hypothetical protein A2U01_0073043, partial [Trifolium medium]|nr:hypothetical protein [Trifolium medium]